MKPKDKNKKRERKVVYNPEYNRTQILKNDPEFKKAVRNLKREFTNLGCPLPKDGLKTERDFEKWKEKYFKCRKKKSVYTGFYEGVFDHILIRHNLDPRDKFYRNFLKDFIFFKQQEPATVPLKIKVTANKKTKEEELYIQIFPNTTQKDIERVWKIIEKEKKTVFKDKRLKSKKWERRELDIKIYNLKKSFEKMPLKERRKKYGDGRLEVLIKSKLGNRYGKLTFESIRQSVNRVKKYKKVTDDKRFNS